MAIREDVRPDADMLDRKSAHTTRPPLLLNQEGVTPGYAIVFISRMQPLVSPLGAQGGPATVSMVYTPGSSCAR